MPSLEVQRRTEADIPRVFENISLAFANDHEYVDAVFSAHYTPAGRKSGIVDNDTGKVVAAAKWNTYKGGEVPLQPEIEGDYWENEEEKEFAQCIFHVLFAPRQRVIEETNAHLVALETMMVDPAYQGMGAGRLLVRWSLAQADKMGVNAVVEGSERGRRLYASEGFDGHHYVVPVPEKFAARRKQTYWWMRRPAQNRAMAP